jgi:hypothetical protein
VRYIIQIFASTFQIGRIENNGDSEYVTEDKFKMRATLVDED